MSIRQILSRLNAVVLFRSGSTRAAFVFARGEQMAKEVPGDKEDDAGCSTECGVQEPEVRRGHFLEEAADPADKVVRGEQMQIKDADDRGR